MGNRLVIAEKPSLARAIANGIGPNKRDGNSLVCSNGDVVTYCFGHLLGLKDPPDYNPRYKKWKEEDLPIIPAKFEMKPNTNDGASAQLKFIGTLLKRKEFTSILHAGDPDREGQLIIDEVLEWFGNKKPVERIWIAALDDVNVAKSLSKLEDNALPKYKNLRNSAKSRSEADWLVGMNLTRAMTIRAQAHGVQSSSAISGGRVQSALLALMADRCREIENFKPINYFIPMINAQGIKAALTMGKDDPGMDADGRLVDESVANKLIDGVSGSALVDSVKKSKSKKAPPLPFSLSTLQKEANAKFGLSAADTLGHVQKLYDDGEVTYPRTDCNYMPEDQFVSAPDIIKSLGIVTTVAAQADPSIKSSAWNDKKITAHHALMPTTKKCNKSGATHDVYLLIVEGYLRQFFPDQEVERVVVTLKTSSPSGKFWTASVSRTASAGWTVTNAISKGKEKAEDKPLPDVNKGDTLTIDSVWNEAKKTTPPAYFNDGTLIEAMTNVHRFVTDPAVKAMLREGAGIGTEATRAATIETVIKRAYVKRSGKKLMVTELGFLVNDTLPSAVRDPGMTAMWEGFLDAIGNGTADMDSFSTQIGKAVTEMVHIVADTHFPGREIHACPICSKAMRKLESKKKKGNFFWVCTGDKDCPLMSDDNGSPGKAFGS